MPPVSQTIKPHSSRRAAKQPKVVGDLFRLSLRKDPFHRPSIRDMPNDCIRTLTNSPDVLDAILRHNLLPNTRRQALPQSAFQFLVGLKIEPYGSAPMILIAILLLSSDRSEIKRRPANARDTYLRPALHLRSSCSIVGLLIRGIRNTIWIERVWGLGRYDVRSKRSDQEFRLCGNSVLILRKSV